MSGVDPTELKKNFDPCVIRMAAFLIWQHIVAQHELLLRRNKGVMS
ncbi:MAG: hypothetical protein H6887_03770 [Hoeflea sp.]|nr:hypothetical protein [Hoeflea sp.]